MDQTNSIPETTELLKKRSLTDEVYDFLYGKIIAGKFSTGDWLRQDDISTQLGVSQTPVREALDRLVASGLAERVPFRGVRVPKLEPKEIIDAFMLRLVLENLAACIAARVIQPDEVQHLSDLVEQTADLLSLEDMSTLRQINKEIHSGIVNAAGSQLLSKLYEMATNSFPDWMLYEYMFRHPELLQNSLKREYVEHKAIIEALAQKNPQAASKHVINHIGNLGNELELFLNISGESIHEMENLIKPMLSLEHK
jgi:DNA-binding GntR family transcriptional regulator